MLKKLLFPFLILAISVIFFWQFFFKGLLPIPSDTIVGLYHPFRDLYAKDYPRGIPFKNFLITDPIRQQIPWKKLVVENFKKFEIPIWNPYSFSGTPLLANFQSGAFYPLNLFLFLPFSFGWSLMIVLQIILAGIFMFYYLRNQKLNDYASLIGSISFAFSGFFIAWLEWNTILQTALWFPSILLSVEKIFSEDRKKFKWQITLVLSLVFSFFAGHLQVFFYEILFLILYIAFYIERKRISRKSLYLFALPVILSLVLAIPQLIPTLKFILLSSRGLDLVWTNPGWFIPIQNLVQFLVPDYFGNPTTLNYFGIWNYAEFIGFIGVIPLVFAFHGLLTQRKRTAFFGFVILISLFFAIQNPISELPFKLNIPFLSSSQPTRLIFLITFSLSTMAAFGLDQFMKRKDKKILPITLVFFGVFGLLFITTYLGNMFHSVEAQNLLVARRNIYFPFAIFAGGAMLMSGFIFLKDRRIGRFVILGLILITVIDLLRFGWKFTPFTKSEYLFPTTKTTDFLQNQKDKNFRIMSTDSRILPPNFSSIYKIQSIEGYDPLYIRRYTELISAMQRGKPDIIPPFGFNRIITPHDLENKFINLLNVKYVLSLSEINNPDYRLAFEEGQTKIYENLNVLPRAFFVSSVVTAKDKSDAIEKMFTDMDFSKTAVVEDSGFSNQFSVGKSTIIDYSDNEVIVQTDNQESGFLVLLDSFYPTWKAKIDGKDTKIFITNYNFRGIAVPAGKHTVRFYISLL